MIKRLLSTMAVGAMLLTSCQSDDAIINGGDGNVTFTASLPGGIQGRSAYDDGTVATELTCAVYDAAGTNISGLTTTATLANKAAQVSLSLVTGKIYTVVFWAEAETSPYTLDTTTGTVTVNATDGKVTGAANDKNRDAFFAVEKFTVTGAINKEVTLKRPFAQINIGTSDLDAFTTAGGSITTSGLTVKDVPNVLNLIDGSVSGSVDYVYTPAALVADTETFPVAGGYRWLTANYILTGDTKTTVYVEWTSDNDAAPSVTYSYVPVQRNYRTNIYGALLTNPAEYNVKVNEEFGGELTHEILVADQASFEAAITDPEIEVIKLGDDLTLDLSAPLVIDSNSTTSEIDLAGHTLSIESSNANASAPVLLINSKEDFVISNGKIESEALHPISCEYSTVTMEDVEINLDNDNYATGIQAFGCEVNLSNTTVETNGSGFELVALNFGENGEWHSDLYAENCKFYQNSGTLEAENGNGHRPFIFSINAGTGFESANTITLKNCEVSSYRGIIAANSGENVIIDGGTYATFEAEDDQMGIKTPMFQFECGKVEIKNAKLYFGLDVSGIWTGISGVDFGYPNPNFRITNVLTKAETDNDYQFFKYSLSEDRTDPGVYSKNFATTVSETAILTLPDGKTTKVVTFDQKYESYSYPAVTD